MKGWYVELRRDGEQPQPMRPEDYVRLPEDMVADRTAHVMVACDVCHTQHEIGTWEEFAAVIFAGQRPTSADAVAACPVDRARGGQ